MCVIVRSKRQQLCREVPNGRREALEAMQFHR
jgi:hypothetical protein